jgi:hypothetical protein
LILISDSKNRVNVKIKEKVTMPVRAERRGGGLAPTVSLTSALKWGAWLAALPGPLYP